MKASFLLVLAIASFLAPGRDPSMQERPIAADFIELVAVPDRYEGKVITVRGFLRIGERPETNQGAPILYFHREDFENALGNSFWVEPNEQMRRDQEKLNLMYVVCAGRFVRLGPPGDPDARTFVIKEVQGCTPWSDPNRPKNLKSSTEKLK